MMTTPVRELQRYWNEQHRARTAAPHTAVSVALMREAGTPGTQVAHEAGARLGWQVYDQNLLEGIANELGLRHNLLDSVDERHKSWLTECIEAFGSVPSVSENTYVRHLVQTVLPLGAHGHCVIVGRGSAFILPGDRTLRILLVGDLKDRIEGAARRQGLSLPEAARWVEQTQRDRARFVRDHFQKEISEPHHYDLILNSSRWSVAECADLLVKAVRQREARLAGA